MASRPSYRPGMPKLSRYGISKAPSSVNISAAFFGSRNDAAVNSSSSSFAFFMYDPFCHGSVVGERNDVAGRLRSGGGCARGEGEGAHVEQCGASERKADGLCRRPAVEGGGEHGDAQGRADLAARIEHRAADARERRGHAGEDGGVHRGRDQRCPKAGEREQRPLQEEGPRGGQLGESQCAGAEDGKPADDGRACSIATGEAARDDARHAEEDADDTEKETRG